MHSPKWYVATTIVSLSVAFAPIKPTVSIVRYEFFLPSQSSYFLKFLSPPNKLLHFRVRPSRRETLFVSNKIKI